MYNRLSLQTKSILFEEGEGCTQAILDRQVHFVLNSTSSSTDAYPACTTVAIFAHFWAIEARRGEGGGGG